MYSEILDKVRTKQEAVYLKGEIDLLLKAIYQSKETNFQEVLDKNVRSWVSELLRKGIEKSAINNEPYLKGLKRELSDLKSLNLTIAFEPTEKNLHRLHNWVLDNLGKGIVLEIIVNANILGGSIISYQGKFFDSSVRNKLRNVFRPDNKMLTKLLSE